MAMHVKSGGTWRQVKTTFVKTGGVWRAVQRSYVKSGGVWRLAAQNEVVATVASNTPHIVLPGPYFSAADWANPLLNKRLVINSGVIVWAYNIGAHAINCGSGRQGGLQIDNFGQIWGHSGLPGSAGGDAIYARQLTAINNRGMIAGGGGGGGQGGQGGPGYYDTPSTAVEGPAYARNNYDYKYRSQYSNYDIWWAGVRIAQSVGGGPTNVADWTYYRTVLRESVSNGGIGQGSDNHYEIRREQPRSTRTNTPGGPGGQGGRGKGYNSSLGNLHAVGAGGGGGGANAGTGGQGGTGGDWGQNGNTGNPGGAGNAGGGNGGLGGGPTGRYLDGNGYVNWVATGTRYGGTIN